ncbi:MAG: choice-of-anchor Q domain-containing protein [bacterium]|nr:choice-of-anchor Q domain-containing protein [bacterium]
MENSAAMGGAMAFCDGVMQSNLIISNSADEQAGGLARCDGSIVNNTIYGNSAGLSGGGIYNCMGTIANCIFWANDAVNSGDQIDTASIPSFSCIQDWTGGGTGNMTSPPAFRDAPRGDYRLEPGSPCVDAGDNMSLGSFGLDLDGNLRIAFGGKSLTVDMGAYEHNAAPFVLTALSVVNGESLVLTWNSQPLARYMVWLCDDLSSGEWVRARKAPISSQGESTSFTLSVPTTVQFFRVEM